VGGGIIGVSLAFELRRRGQSVLVLDRQEPGREASWAAAGTISPAPDRESLGIAALGCESYRLYPEFAAAIEKASGKSSGFHPNGAMELFFDPDSETECDRRVEEIQNHGIAAEAISLDEAKVREPAIGPATRAALWIRDEAYLDPRGITHVAIAAALKAGVEMHSNSDVISVLVEQGRCSGVLVADAEKHRAGELGIRAGEKIAARNVVIAAGWRSGEIGGVESYAPTTPVRGQMVALGKVSGAPRTILRCDLGYMAPREDGRTVVGSTLESGTAEKHTTPAGVQKILGAALTMAPGLASAPILETWAGVRPDSPDHLPIIGPTNVEGLFIATGHYRNGMLLAPVTAKYLAEWIAGGKPSAWFEPFSPLRFAATSNAFRAVDRQKMGVSKKDLN
ncbi:MAG TPA: FAD-dependent oxidoreductase, partial [Candidatus Acidoferrales bacterium]|nr:FAD-dependent oxidoreductase [Candidatus Acidoferrales bacterium]